MVSVGQDRHEPRVAQSFADQGVLVQGRVDSACPRSVVWRELKGGRGRRRRRAGVGCCNENPARVLKARVALVWCKRKEGKVLFAPILPPNATAIDCTKTSSMDSDSNSFLTLLTFSR
jgi:hypothetical protein